MQVAIYFGFVRSMTDPNSPVYPLGALWLRKQPYIVEYEWIKSEWSYNDSPFVDELSSSFIWGLEADLKNTCSVFEDYNLNSLVDILKHQYQGNITLMEISTLYVPTSEKRISFTLSEYFDRALSLS